MTPFDLAQRYAGIGELAGALQHPLIQWWHSLCGLGYDQPDETPWCSSFVNGICWELRLPRSKSPAARSWLTVGTAIDLMAARPGHDIVVLKRGSNPAAGHVGFYAGLNNVARTVELLAGNQGNRVSIAPFPIDHILSVRRLAPGA